MILESTGKQPVNLVDCLDLITFLALACLWAEGLIIRYSRWIDYCQITFLAYYDYGWRVVSGYGCLWTMSRIFAVFYIVFLLIETLEGMVKWLQC